MSSENGGKDHLTQCLPCELNYAKLRLSSVVIINIFIYLVGAYD